MLFSPQILSRGRAMTVVAGIPATPITFTAPNDFSNAAWTLFTSSATSTTVLAPDGNNTASTVTSAGTGFVSARTSPSVNMGGQQNVVFSITGYIKSVVAPVWFDLTWFDATNGTELFQVWGNATSGGGSTGTMNGENTGVVDSWVASAAGNNYTKFVLKFHNTISSGTGNIFDIRFQPADNDTSGGSSGQSFNVWGWGA